RRGGRTARRRDGRRAADVVTVRRIRFGVECRPATVHAGSFVAPRRARRAPRPSMPGFSSFVVEPGALVESGRGSILARWSAPIASPGFQLTDADLASRARFFSGKLAEGSLLATARYDRGPLDALASANSAVRLQVGTTGSTRGL